MISFFFWLLQILFIHHKIARNAVQGNQNFFMFSLGACPGFPLEIPLEPLLPSQVSTSQPRAWVNHDPVRFKPKKYLNGQAIWPNIPGWGSGGGDLLNPPPQRFFLKRLRIGTYPLAFLIFPIHLLKILAKSQLGCSYKVCSYKKACSAWPTN